MKHLRIECDNVVLFDADVVEISWSDTGDQVTVTGKTQRSAGTSKLVQMLSEAVRKQTEQTDAMVEDRKAELAAEKKARHRADTPVIIGD